MIQWRSSAQLAYSGGEFADLFRGASEWSVVSHIPVNVTSAVESVGAQRLDGSTTRSSGCSTKSRPAVGRS